MKPEMVWEPARKPRHQQHTAVNRFICDRCHTKFTTRFAQTRHFRTFHTMEKEQKRRAIKERKLEAMRRKQQVSKKEQELLPVIKRPRGRPAHPNHICISCGEQFETACRKRDH